MNTQRAWTKELRDKALALLPDESAWTQGVLGRRADGVSCSFRDERCHSRCLIGVIGTIADPWDWSFRATLKTELQDHLGLTDSFRLLAWNDEPTRTFEEVRRAFETVPVREDE